MLDDRLHPRGGGEPSRQAHRRAGHRGDGPDDRAVSEQDEAHMLVGRADGSQHAQRPHPAPGHHREPGHGHQTDEEQSDRREDEDLQRGGDVLVRGPDLDIRPVDGRGRGDLLLGGSDQDRHRVRGIRLTRGYQSELVQQVQGVLDQTDHPPIRPALAPCAPKVQLEDARHRIGHRDLTRPQWIPALVHAQRRTAVGPVRAFGPEIDRGHRPGDRHLPVLDHLDAAERPSRRGDVGAEVRIGPVE